MNTKSYFFQSFAIIALAFVAFIGFKQILPDKIFPESKVDSKNVLVDSMLLESFEKEGVSKKGDSTDADQQGNCRSTKGFIGGGNGHLRYV